MKKINHLIAAIGISLLTFPQIVNAQASHKKTPTGISSAPAAANYIAHEIAKNGGGDNGVFYDTVRNKINLTDPANPGGKQYQDINVTLDAGDVIKASAISDITTPMTLALLNTVNGHLSVIKAIIDTVRSPKFTVFYKASAAGAYTLRVACKKRAPTAKDDRRYYYENSTAYKIVCVISTPASGVIKDNPAVCDQLQFLLRQRLTNFMQITGELSDTTMDVLDKKKIQSLNHFSTFSFYKNSMAKIDVDPGFDYMAFDQSLFYRSDADAAQAQRYFINQFKACLGAEWTEGVETGDENWHKFEKQGYNSISIILYPGYKYLQILL